VSQVADTRLRTTGLEQWRCWGGRGGRSAPGGTLGFAVGYEPAKAVLK